MAEEEQVFDPAQSVANAAAVASGAGTASAGQVAATNGVTPQAVQQQNIRIGQPYDMTQQGVLQLNQEDFYPGPGVAYDQYDTGLVLTPRSPQTPLGAISKAAALLQQRQQRVDQAMKDFDLYAGIGSAADPYDQNFKKIAIGKLNDWRQGIANAYTGGDIKQANRLIYTNPQLRDQWRGLAMQINAMGVESKFIAKEADDYLKKVASNEIEFEDDTVQAAQKMLFALNEFRTEDGSQGDVMKQLAANRDFQQRLSRDKFFKDFVVPGLEQAKGELGGIEKIEKRGNTFFIYSNSKENFDALKSEMTRQLVRVSGLSQEDAKRYMDSRLGFKDVTELKTAQDYVPSGSGASQSRTSITGGMAPSVSSEDAFLGVDSYYSKLDQKLAANIKDPAKNPPLTPKERRQLGIMTVQNKAMQKNGQVQRVAASVVTGGQAKPIGIRKYGDTYIAGEQFERAYDAKGDPIKRQFYIVGREVGPELQQELLSAQMVGDMSAVTSSEAWKRAPIVYKLVSDADPELREYYKEHIPEGQTFVDVLERAVGGTPAPKQAQARITPEDFNTKWASLRSGESLVGPDGVTYTKK